MEFLKGMKQAEAMGIEAQEFLNIWKQEMALKQQASVAEFSKSSGDDSNDENVQREIKTMLNQLILKQEHFINTQQEQFQQLQQNFLQLQQRHDQLESHVLDQLCRAETALNNLTSISSETASKSPNVNIQEELSVERQERHSNVTANDLQQLKNDLVSEIVDKVHNTIKAVVPNADFVNSDILTCELYDASTGAENSDQEQSDKHETNAVRQGKKKVSSAGSKEVDAMKAMIRNELNAMIVQIKKLLLTPLTSDDLIVQFTERVRGLLSYERNVMIDNLQECTSAVTDEISTRMISLQKCLKDEIMRLQQEFANFNVEMDDTKSEKNASSDDVTQKQRKMGQMTHMLKQTETLKLEMVKVSNEVKGLKTLLLTELPVRIGANIGSSEILDKQPVESMKDISEPHPNMKNKKDSAKQTAPSVDIKLVEKKFRYYKFLWHFHSVTKLFHGKITLFANITDITEGYRLRLQAYFAANQMDFALVGVSGKKDNELVWPVNVKVTLNILDPSTKNSSTVPELTTTKVKILKKPQPAEGLTKPEFLYYFLKSKVHPYIDIDDALYFHVIIEIIDNR